MMEMRKRVISALRRMGKEVPGFRFQVLEAKAGVDFTVFAEFLSDREYACCAVKTGELEIGKE